MLPTPTAPSPSSPLPDIQRLAWRCRPIARAILCRRNVRADAARSLLPARLKAAREANSPDTPRHPPCPVGHAPEPGWPAVSRRSGIRGAAHMRRLIGFHPRLASASIATDAALSPVQKTPFKALISHCFLASSKGMLSWVPSRTKADSTLQCEQRRRSCGLLWINMGMKSPRRS